MIKTLFIESKNSIIIDNRIETKFIKFIKWKFLNDL